MKRSRRSYLLLGLLGWTTGCATPVTQFVPNSPMPALAPKTPDQVTLYYQEKDVPFHYAELGWIYLPVTTEYLSDPAKQIAEIRLKASAIGADAVVLNSSYATLSAGSYTGFRRGGAGSSYGYGGTMFTGIAIVKK